LVGEDGAVGPLSFSVGDVETAAEALAVLVSSSNPSLFPPSAIVTGGVGGARTLTLQAAADQWGAATVTVTVRDSEGALVSTSFEVIVEPVNDLPTITSLVDQFTDEDKSLGPLLIIVGDAETPPETMVVAAHSSNSALVADAGITIANEGPQRWITVAPLPEQSGVTKITITTQDGDGGAALTQFQLTVQAINDPPVLSAVADQMIEEDGTLGPVVFMVRDEETAENDLILSVTSSNPALVTASQVVFDGDGSTRFVSITPQPDQTGAAEIAITLTDAEGAATVVTFMLQVSPVNDAPAMLFLSYEQLPNALDTALGPAIAGRLMAADVDSAASSLAFRLIAGEGDSDNGQFQIVDDELQIKQHVPIDAELQSAYAVRIEVSDGESTFERGFVLEVVDPAILRRWQNPLDRWDVNEDSTVDVADILAVVRHLRENGLDQRLATAAGAGRPYVDVNGDNLASLGDLLEMIARLRDNASAQEGERDTLFFWTQRALVNSM
jgi:hypothetical protein